MGARREGRRGILSARWREPLAAKKSRDRAHRIHTAVADPQHFVQRGDNTLLRLAPRAEAGDEQLQLRKWRP